MTTVYKNSEQLYWVRDNIISAEFPPVHNALNDPDGLLAIGGSLNVERLINAYKQGIFPWYNEGQPVLWWSPDPRWVLDPRNIKISRSLNKTLRKNIFKVTINQAFEEVISMCASPRKDDNGTWITPDLKAAFLELHEYGYAHSIECWHEDILAGGLYGIAMDRIFFGESMFSRVNDASKIALIYLADMLNKRQFRYIDCQVYTRHLESLGAFPIKREKFVDILNNCCNSSVLHEWNGVLEL